MISDKHVRRGRTLIPLKELRELNDMSQGTAASLLGVTGYRMYARWENGDAAPKIKKRMLFAEYIYRLLPNKERSEFDRYWSCLKEAWGWHDISDADWSVLVESSLTLPANPPSISAEPDSTLSTNPSPVLASPIPTPTKMSSKRSSPTRYKRASNWVSGPIALAIIVGVIGVITTIISTLVAFGYKQSETSKKIYQYALDYGSRAENSDGCYIYATWANDDYQCYYEKDFDQPRDGAHFVDCALKAGGVDGAKCNALDSNLTMDSVRAMILGSNPKVIDIKSAEPGDVFLAYDPSDKLCWGGIVARTDMRTSSGLTTAVHSMVGTGIDQDTLLLDPAQLGCGYVTPGRARLEFYRFD
jgi:transcriptional regulator with XRE-family HTH domain